MPLGIATALVASLLFNGTFTQFLAIAVSLIVVMCAITLLIALAHVAMALHQLVLLKIEPTPPSSTDFHWPRFSERWRW
jgi:hypothetical protein